MQLPTLGVTLVLSRNYDSVRAIDGLFGRGWSSNLTGRLAYTTYLYSAPSTYYKEAVVLMPNGRPVRFRENEDGVTYTPIEAAHHTLVKNGDRKSFWCVARIRIVARERKYGESIRYLNAFALMAGSAADKTTARILMNRIGDRWEPDFWKEKKYFDGYNQWANG